MLNVPRIGEHDLIKRLQSVDVTLLSQVNTILYSLKFSASSESTSIVFLLQFQVAKALLITITTSYFI